MYFGTLKGFLVYFLRDALLRFLAAFKLLSLEMNGYPSTSTLLAVMLHSLVSYQALLYLSGFIKNMAKAVAGEMAQ